MVLSWRLVQCFFLELFPATSVYASVLGGKVSSLEDVDSSVSVLGSATPCHVASLPQEETALAGSSLV